jgi:hypothetical protein
VLQYILNPQADPTQNTVVLGKREVSAVPEMDGLKKKRAILTDITNVCIDSRVLHSIIT